MKLNAFGKYKGWIEVICGPMFAGKSVELLRRINRFKYADISYVLFKPKTDTRSSGCAKSRDGRVNNAIEVETAQEILNYINNSSQPINAVAIDEAQFFDDELGSVCNQLANKGIVVFAVGLDLDFKAVPFSSMTKLLAYADHVTKLTAVCTICGAEATRSQRLIDGKPASINDPIVQIGDKETYEARCRKHHEIKK